MKPLQLMEVFTNLLEGSKLSLNEKELNFLSELSFSRLINRECTICLNNGLRIYDCWINKIDFILIKKDDFIDDLTFVALQLEAIGTNNKTIHSFVDFVLRPKLPLFFGDSKKLHEEIITKIESSLYDNNQNGQTAHTANCKD